MSGYIVSFDIGIASVGWCVMDNTGKIIECGSNLFSAAEASENQTRRNVRGIRRLHRRQKTRIDDFKKLWKNNGLKVPEYTDNNVLDLRNKAIKSEIEKTELYFVLLNMLKHRGISYLDDAEDAEVKGKNDYSKGLLLNEKELEVKFPCQIQKERLDEYGYYHGEHSIKKDEENIVLSNVFTKSRYRDEIQTILGNQSYINSTFTEEYLKIFDRKRNYYEGPGNELSRTDYGKYTTQIDSETGEYITEENIFEKLIGKCSVYPEERRSAAASYTAQEFNLLNDLNTFVVNGRKLEPDEKREIIDIILNSNTVSMKKIISKVIGEKINSMSGVRIDKNDKEIFFTFEQYRKMKKAFVNNELDINKFSREDLDLIGEILTINTEKDQIMKAFKKSPININSKEIEVLIGVKKSNGRLFSKWHSFSNKIMRELIDEMYEVSKNQMQLLTEMKFFEKNESSILNGNKLNADVVNEKIYNPVVKRSIRITIKIFNALIKKYGYPDKVVIEMPRDKNSDDEKERIKEFQKERENELKNIAIEINSTDGIDVKDKKTLTGISLDSKELENKKGLAFKLKLWNEQKGKSVYSGREIDLKELIEDHNKQGKMFEIDHIIPFSISLDDSRSNKVLVYADENQKKRNRTPYYYLSSFDGVRSYEEYASEVKSIYKDNNKYNRKKLGNLLYMEDITKIEVVQGFINRNLNDTRYASKVILNTFQNYFKIKNKDTKVKVIRGKFTSILRSRLQLDKDREESYSHHAVDAMIMGFSEIGYNDYKNIRDKVIDFNTGEILDEEKYNKLNDEIKNSLFKIGEWNKKILEAEKNVKFWHKVDKKPNRGLCNQTIRGTREIDGKIYKINKIDIYSRDGYKTFCEKVKKGKESDFLMYRNDPKTWEELISIYEQYKEQKNAFVAYKEEEGDVVRKYSKKRNGVPISKIKYIDGEVNSCIDISHKYGFNKGEKKVILENLKPYRMDVYYNTNDSLYYLVGIKYSDLKAEGKHIVLDMDKYENILVNEKMLEVGEKYDSLKEKGFTFKFSFFENDIIEYEKNGELYLERFLSRTMPKKRNYIETKPINKAKFEKQHLVGLSKTKTIKKYNTDILGNRYILDKDEKFSRYID